MRIRKTIFAKNKEGAFFYNGVNRTMTNTSGLIIDKNRPNVMLLNIHNGDFLRAYQLSSEGSISSFTLIQQSPTITLDSQSTGFYISPSGINYIFNGSASNRIIRLVASTPHNISTLANTDTTPQVYTISNSDHGILCNNTGLTIYVSSNSAIYKTDLTTPYDLTTANGYQLLIARNYFGHNYITDLKFINEGRQCVFVSSNTNTTVELVVCDLTNPYLIQLSNIVRIKKLPITSVVALVGGTGGAVYFDFSIDGKKLYVKLNNSITVEFDLQIPFNLDKGLIIN